MGSLKPLLERRPRAIANALLRAGQRQQPPAEAQQRLLAALISAGAIAKVSSASAAAGVSAMTAAAMPSAAKGATAGLLGLVAKWGALGATVGALTVGGVELTGESSRLPASPAPAAAPARLAAPRSGKTAAWLPAHVGRAAADETGPIAALGTAAESIPVEPSRRPTGVGVPSRSSEPRGALAPGDRLLFGPLGPEVALLDQARERLRNQAPREALERLDQFASAFPHARLAEEAAMIRIEALLASEQKQEACRLAARFLVDHRANALPQRIRDIAFRCGLSTERNIP